jgi:hypothetical protein
MFTITSGNIPQKLVNQLNNIPEWRIIKEEIAREADIDERVQSVLQKCMENDDFKSGWEKVRTSYGRYPDISVIEGEESTTNKRFVKFPAGDFTLKILRPPVISLSTNFFPVLAILSLATEIFRLSEPDKSHAFSKMLIFCKPEYLRLENPLENSKTIHHDLGNATVEIAYAQGSVLPEVNLKLLVPSLDGLSEKSKEILSKLLSKLNSPT